MDEIETKCYPITREEDTLIELLRLLKENVFITSQDCETGDIEQLNPRIEDLEGTIIISGEWDREDLKRILSNLLIIKEKGEGVHMTDAQFHEVADKCREEGRQETLETVIREVKKQKFTETIADYDTAYNLSLNELLSLLTALQDKKDICK